MIPPHHPFSAKAALAALACATFCLPHLVAATNKNPSSKLYVADVKGQSDLTTQDSITPLTKHTVFDAQGTLIRTAEKSEDTMVYSNGTGIYLDADTDLNVKKFVQEPFTPNRIDLEVEPSISQTQAFISHGVVGLCTSKLVAGSNMVYDTPQASIAIRGKRVVIEVSDTETRVSVVEGEVTVRAGPDDAGGEILKGGQQALVRSDASGNSRIVEVKQIPDARRKFLDDRVALACISRRTVYFEIITRGQGTSQTQEIVANEVVPATKPTDFTISPSRLP